MIFFRRRPWVIQPPAGVPLDKSNALTRKLVAAYVSRNGRTRNLVTGAWAPWTTNSAEPSSVPGGVPAAGYGDAIASSHDYYSEAGDTFDPFAANDDVTFAFWCKQEAFDVFRYIFRRGKDGQGNGWSLLGGFGTNGKPSFGVAFVNPSTNSYWTGGSDAYNPLGEWVVCRIRQNIDISCWYNNKLQGSTSATNCYGMRTSTRGLALGATASSTTDNNLTENFVGKVGDVFVWNRSLPDDEVIRFLREPWQLFVPERQLVLVGTGSTNATVNVTGVSAASALGSVAVSGDANVAASGVAATGGIGAVVAATSLEVSISGVSAAGALGLPAIEWSGSIAVGGISAAGNLGAVTVTTTGDAIFGVSGIAASGNLGTVSITASADVSIAGVSATGALGSVVAATSLDVAVSGIAGTANVGSVTVSGSANVVVSGVNATGNLGAPTIEAGGNIDVSVAGVSATGNLGSVAPQWDCTVTPAGLAAAGALGSVTVQAGNDVSFTPAGVAATGALGVPDFSIGIDVQCGGVSAAGAIGTVSIGTGTAVAVAGVSATGELGTLAFGVGINVAVSGVGATGNVGSVYVDQGGLLYVDRRFYGGNPKRDRITDTP